MFRVIYFILVTSFSVWNTLLVSAENYDGVSGVFTESAIFERLSHFKDAGLVNHLNTVDEAMIADGIYRMFHRGWFFMLICHHKVADFRLSSRSQIVCHEVARTRVL